MQLINLFTERRIETYLHQLERPLRFSKLTRDGHDTKSATGIKGRRFEISHLDSLDCLARLAAYRSPEAQDR
jgi:hypothetical protein